MRNTYRLQSMLLVLLGLGTMSLAQGPQSDIQSKPQEKGAASQGKGFYIDFEALERKAESKKDGKVEEKEMGRNDARDFWYEQRSFGVGFIDIGAYERAVRYRDEFMAPGKLGGGAGPSQSRAAIASTWQFLGPNNLGGAGATTPFAGRVNGIAYLPGSSTSFYIATSSGGVWKTTDGGTTFTPLTDNKFPFLYTGSIAVHPGNGNVVYAGTGDFNGDYSINGQGLACGLMKSADGGATWTQLGTAQNFKDYSISDIIVDPESPWIVTIAQGRGRLDNGFIWRSTDAGATWTKVVTTGSTWSDLAYTAISGGVRYYYAISADGPLYRSADRGATWTALVSPVSGGGYTNRIATHPTTQAIAYILDSNGSRVWKTGNIGASWLNVTNNLGTIANWGQSWYDAFIAVGANGGNDIIYVGLIDLFVSTNSGASWASIGDVYGGNPKLHPDMQSFAFDPNVPNVQGMIGTDGGVYSFNYNVGTNTLTCSSKNANLGITEFYHLDIHPTNANTVLAGAQDNSTAYSQGGNTANWQLEIGGDGGYCAINPANPLNQYGSYVFGNIYMTNDDWNTGFQIQGQLSGTAFIAPFVLDPNNPNILFSGAQRGVNKYDRSTGLWSNHLGGQNLTGNYLLAVAVAPSNSSRIYTGAVDGQVWMTTNGGASWTQINTGTTSLPSRAITSISVSPTNPDDILVGLSGTGTAHLYRCTNPTSGSRSWTSVNGGVQALPDIPLNTVVRDPVSPSTTWFVGTDAGVMQTVDGGASWQNFTAPMGLPNVQVNFLKIRASDRYMYAATWGRGVWRIQLASPGVVSGISVNQATVPSGTNVTGTVSLYQPAPTGGVTVNLASNNAAATVPATVTVPQGATSQTFTINTSNATYANIGATITQTLTGDPNHTVNVTVMPANYAQFIGQTVPSSMTAGQTYGVTLQFKNTGGTTWTSGNGFKAGSANPYNNTTWGLNRITLTNGPIAPGATGTFSANVIAPPNTGTYNFQWRMVQDPPGFFGPLSTNVAITVTKLADAARFLSRTGATTVNAGSDFWISNTMRNVGTNTWTPGAGYQMMSVSPNNNTTWGRNTIPLPAGSSTAPNAQVTATGLCTAPSTPGSYTMQWQMAKGATPFGDKTQLVTMTVVQGPDNAKFVSQTGIPVSIGPGKTFNATITMLNAGTAAWDNTYSLVPVGNNFGVASIVSGSVAPNTNGVFNATFTTPATPGTYPFKWRMKHGSTFFGEYTAHINVVASNDAALYISRTGALTVNAGQDFWVSYTMKNTGITTWTGGTGYAMAILNPLNNLVWGRNRLWLSSSVAPDAQTTISGLCTAPTTPGTYPMQWQMAKSGTPFGQAAPQVSISVVQGPDNAVYVSQTGIPATIARNTTFNATITMTNKGTATWNGTYSLVPIGSNTWGVAGIVSGTVAPNANGVFNATFTAPGTAGTYTFQMRMAHSGTKFGASTPVVTITVT